MPTQSLKILIVDDEPSTRVLLATILEQLGHEVRSAQDGFSALARIRESVPEVLLSDLNMPGMSGFELLSVVRRRLPAIYVIATSGAYAGPAVPHGIAADAFYEKATSLLTLLNLVKAEELGESPRHREEGADMTVWIPAGLAAAGVAQGILTCPECLRAFPQAFLNSKSATTLVHETGCAYCGVTIHYAVVQALDPGTSQPYEAKTVAVLAAFVTPEEMRDASAGPMDLCA
jgi:CheY-like chemotaxis protein